MESPHKTHHDPLQSPKELHTPPILHHHSKKRLTYICLLIIITILTPIVFPRWVTFALVPITLYLELNRKLKLIQEKPGQVYMVDFACYTPPPLCRVPRATFLEHVSTMGIFDNESVSFMERVLASSGQGERTSLPPALFYIPPRPYHNESLEEAQMVLFPVMDALLRKANVLPKDIDILIVNCSGACPSPSLSSIIVNKFGLREDVKSFTLSGMGCSASMLAVDMAANLLKVNKNSNAVIVSTEILTTGWYTGKEHSKLALNCLFRMGSAAILLTNIEQAKLTSKYKLIFTQRTHLASNDRAYRSAFREEDEQGNTGVTLTRDILHVTAEAIKTSIIHLASSVLPISEKLKCVTSLINTHFFKGGKEGVYVPNFKSAIAHFCVPTSGRRFIREIANGLRLDEEDMEAAMSTLHRFGNQSSSALWYELAYLEAKGLVKEGDKVWQLGIGTGVKSTSVVWERIGPVSREPNMGPWADCIHEYPKLAFDFD